MNQSGFIFGALLAGFVLFIAARERLPLYASVVWGPAPAQPSAGGAGGSAGSSGGSIGGAVGHVILDFLGLGSLGDLAGSIGEGIGLGF